MPQQNEMTPEQYAALEPDKVLRIMQIIAGALIAGVLSFATVASIVVFSQAPAAQPGGQPPAGIPPNATEVLMYVVLTEVVLFAVLSFVVPNVLAKAQVKGIAKMAQDGTATGSKELFGRLLAAAQIKMIIALALIELAAFINLYLFMSTKSLVPPAGVGALLLVMAIHFPTKFKLARWLEDQQRVLS